MKTLQKLFLLVGCIFLSFCKQPIQSNEMYEAASMQIKERNQQWIAAIENGDSAALGELYTENAVLMPSNQAAVVGREALKKYLNTGSELEPIKYKVETSELDVIGSKAIEYGNFQVMGEGDQVIDKGKYMVEWRNQNGQWYMHREIFNSDLPYPRAMAQQGQNVWLVVHQVKADRRQDFETFVRNTLVPAIDQTNPVDKMAIQQTRFLKPDKPSEDGSYRYIFIMDPVVEGADYSIEKLMIQKHGEEKGKAIMNDLQSMMAAPFISLEAKQTEI